MRIGLTRYKNTGFNGEWFARIDSRESRCESPVPLGLGKWETNFGRPNFGPDFLGRFFVLFFPAKRPPEKSTLKKFTVQNSTQKSRKKYSHFTSTGPFGWHKLIWVQSSSNGVGVFLVEGGGGVKVRCVHQFLVKPNFLVGYPGILLGYSGVPEKFENKKCLCSILGTTFSSNLPWDSMPWANSLSCYTCKLDLLCPSSLEENFKTFSGRHFVPGEHANVPSFRLSFKETSAKAILSENQPFANPRTFSQTKLAAKPAPAFAIIHVCAFLQHRVCKSQFSSLERQRCW